MSLKIGDRQNVIHFLDTVVNLLANSSLWMDHPLEFSGLTVTIQKIKIKTNKTQTLDKICLNNVSITLQTRSTNGNTKMVIEMTSSFNRHDVYMPLLKNIDIIATNDDTITIDMHENTSSFMYCPTTTRLVTTINASYFELLQTMLSKSVMIKTPEKVQHVPRVSDGTSSKENIISPNTGFPRKINEKISYYAKMNSSSNIATSCDNLHRNSAPAVKKVNKSFTPEKSGNNDYTTIVLTNSQKRALELVKSGKNVFISGSAGTGKSTLIMYIIDYFNRLYGKDKVKLTATTGCAAVQIGGTTIHRFFYSLTHSLTHSLTQSCIHAIGSRV